MNDALITSPLGILMVLAGVTSFFFFLEKKTGWKLFNYFPPLIFIYMIPLVMSNTGLITNQSPVYSWMSGTILPMFLIIMLLDVDVVPAIRIMGRGIFVMFLGTAGVIIGAPIAYFIVKGGLGPDAWKGFGALAGSWIGGTGNMAAVSEAIGTSPTDFGLAAISDNLVYIIWLPIMLGSKNIAGWFHRFTKVDQIRIDILKKASGELISDKGRLEMRHILYLLFLGLVCAWAAGQLSVRLPEYPPVLAASAWKILIITTLGIALSFTPARKIPGSHALAMALVYLFVANMGARANVGDLAGQAPWFLLGAYIWIFIHGAFCVLGAKIFKVDIHSTAIASAANIGGAASAPIVAAYHSESLVPISILMALIGYAIGNYGALLTAWLCSLVA
ncbi:MAG: hypothetical protein CVT49_06335 [candidate division Zixibacteria bacterium HGW-Zixibacteria-1]|nr:MAG: hypothetical protein CVT49_06335 [candidate division Zixibacteria bacterium HGW-Zixibacteria-1]